MSAWLVETGRVSVPVYVHVHSATAMNKFSTLYRAYEVALVSGFSFNISSADFFVPFFFVRRHASGFRGVQRYFLLRLLATLP